MLCISRNTWLSTNGKLCARNRLGKEIRVCSLIFFHKYHMHTNILHSAWYVTYIFIFNLEHQEIIVQNEFFPSDTGIRHMLYTKKKNLEAYEKKNHEVFLIRTLHILHRTISSELCYFISWAMKNQ